LLPKDKLIKESDIVPNNWDYIAFGHYHKFTKLAPNAYYSGAIERTSTNIWQESNDPKGFIEYDLDEKICRFHELKTPRKVVDIKKIDAKELSSEDLNQKIIKKVSEIEDLDKTIVRMTIENIDEIALRGLDYKKIREFKKVAIHFRLNIIKKDSSISQDGQENIPQKKKSITEYLEEEIENFELSQGLNKEKFSKMAKDYLEQSLIKCD